MTGVGEGLGSGGLAGGSVGVWGAEVWSMLGLVYLVERMATIGLELVGWRSVGPEGVDGKEGGAEKGDGEEGRKGKVGEEEVLEEMGGGSEGNKMEAELEGFFVADIAVADAGG